MATIDKYHGFKNTPDDANTENVSVQSISKALFRSSKNRDHGELRQREVGAGYGFHR